MHFATNGLYFLTYRANKPGVGYNFDREGKSWLLTGGVFGLGVGVGWLSEGD